MDDLHVRVTAHNCLHLYCGWGCRILLNLKVQTLQFLDIGHFLAQVLFWPVAARCCPVRKRRKTRDDAFARLAMLHCRICARIQMQLA